jgi:tellurite resistance protein TerC
VLIFIGVKMLIVDFYKIPVGISLGVVAALIASAMLMSLAIKPKPQA